MNGVIGTINYGGLRGKQPPHRQVQFIKDGNGNIYAEIFVYIGGIVGQRISTVPGNYITLREQAQTRSGFKKTNINTLPLSRRISTINDVVSQRLDLSIEQSSSPANPGFENIEDIMIFDWGTQSF